MLNKNNFVQPLKSILLNNYVTNAHASKKAKTILKPDTNVNEYLHSDLNTKKVTFKEDIDKININKYLYNEPAVTNNKMDIDNSDDDINQDVTMHDVANDTALKICTTK